MWQILKANESQNKYSRRLRYNLKICAENNLHKIKDNLMLDHQGIIITENLIFIKKIYNKIIEI